MVSQVPLFCFSKTIKPKREEKTDKQTDEDKMNYQTIWMNSDAKSSLVIKENEDFTRMLSNVKSNLFRYLDNRFPFSEGEKL